jgi:phosphatidyl-myo-inositol alpha-mannosyltransferase
VRVAVVCPYAWDRVGGVQSHVASLADTLRARGHEVLVLAPRSVGAHAREDGVAFTGRAVPVPANGSVAPVAFGPAAAAQVKAEIARFAPDVLHLHEPLIPSTSFLALSATKVPAVGTFHASARSSVGYKLAAPVLQRVAARLTVRTAVSDAARAFALRYFPGEYVLTPNGIDLQRFTSAQPIDLGTGATILFLSRLERRKGAEVLIQAMTRLRDVKASVVIGGDGPERRKLHSLARRLEVPVTFLGRIPHERVPELYASATVYCAPALGGESFGIVLAEAMAAGAPVVCSDLDGFRGVAGTAAKLFPAGDAGALAVALREVLSDPDARSEMTRMGRRLASMYDWSRLAANVEAVYERAAGAQPARNRRLNHPGR